MESKKVRTPTCPDKYKWDLHRGQAVQKTVFFYFILLVCTTRAKWDYDLIVTTLLD